MRSLTDPTPQQLLLPEGTQATGGQCPAPWGLTKGQLSLWSSGSPPHTRWARRPRAAPRGPPGRGGEHNTAVGGWGAAPARGGSLALAGATSFPGQATARAQTDGLGLGDLGSKKLSGKGSRN